MEFEIAGQSYRAGKLNAFQQLHLSRKIAPLLPKVLPALTKMGSGQNDLAALGEALEPVAAALAGMPDADCEYVFGACLGAVLRKQQNNSWAAVWNQDKKALMFDDIDLSVMTQIVVKIVQDSLGPFMQGLLAKAQAGSPALQ